MTGERDDCIGIAEPDIPAELSSAWEILSPRRYVVQIDKGWERIATRLHRVEPALRPLEHKPSRGPRATIPSTAREPMTRQLVARHLRWSAAVVALAGVIGVIGYNQIEGGGVQRSGQQGSVYTTKRGERAQFNLPDGSHVVLGPESRLEYFGGRMRGNRHIMLDGHAYFSVTHQAEHPFIVRARNVTTQVLGTSFTVRAYAGDAEAQVGVTEGKVAIGYEMPETVLMAGDIGTVTPGTPPVITSNATVMDVLGWTRGQFILRDITVERAAVEITRQYDVDIVVLPALRNHVVTLVFTGQPAENLVREMAAMLGATVQRRAQQFVISPST